MRVLFTTVPGYGHFLPVVPLARALVGAGHEVLVATAASFHPVVRSAGLDAATAGMSDAAMVAERRRRWPETDRQPPARWAVRMFAEIAAPVALPDLDRICAEWRPDLLVREEGEYAGALAARTAGIPWVTQGWGSPLPAAEALGEVCDSLSGLWRARGLSPPDPRGLYGELVVNRCPPSLGTEIAGISHCRVQAEQPRLATASTAPTRWAETRTAPVGFVSFGTVRMYRDAPDLLRLAVEALLGVGCDVVATASGARLARELEALGRGRVLVQPFVDLAGLLPACSLVICHGGAGTVLAALSRGLPLLVMPRGSPSQLRMAAACAARGAGRVVEPLEASLPGLRAELDVLRRRSRYRLAAGAVADEIRSAPPTEAVVPWLERLAARGLRGSGRR